MAGKTVTLGRDKGRAFWFLNGRYEIKVSSEESGGVLTVMEMTVPEGWGPPTHTHDSTESVYVLEGTLRLTVDGEVFEAGPGSFVHIPQGVQERPEPIGVARILNTYVPGGIDRFFAEAGVPATADGLPPFNPEPPDLARIVELGGRYGMAFPEA